MDWKLQAVTLPVSDVDRAKAFYVDTLGFTLDVDHSGGEDFRVVQVTPPGSACSVMFGIGVGDGEKHGSLPNTYLVVTDIEAAHAQLDAAGVDGSGIVHFGEAGRAPGPHPDRIDYGSFVFFADPDGNAWAVQEVGHRA